MRISQLESLNESELGLILYIVKMLEPVTSFQISTISDLLWIRHHELIAKLNRSESKLTDEGKEVFKGLMLKLNKSPEQEREEYEHSTKSIFTQSEFQF